MATRTFSLTSKDSLSQKNGISFPNAYRAVISLVEALPLTMRHAGHEILEQYDARTTG